MLTQSIESQGYVILPDPLLPEASQSATSLFSSIVAAHDPGELEAATRHIDAVYDQGFSGYHYSPPNVDIGSPGKHSFCVRTATHSRELVQQVLTDKQNEISDVVDLYRACAELMGGVRPLARAVLWFLDNERPGANIGENHVMSGDNGHWFMADDLRLVLYEASPVGTQLSEPHPDRSSLSFVWQSGGFFVECNDQQTLVDVPDNRIVCFPGRRMTDPQVCPRASLPPTYHGAVNTSLGRRAIITYQVHPLLSFYLA